MNFLLQKTRQCVVTVTQRKIHTTQTLNSAVWKKYRWTPWPWPLGLKHLRNSWNPSRPGYHKMRRPHDRPRPGTEEGQISGPYFRKFSAFFQEEAAKVLRLFTRQCEVYAAQRIRRTQQIGWLYANLYNRQTVLGLLRSILFSPANSRAPGGLIAFVGATVLALEKPEKWALEISENDMERCFDELVTWAVKAKTLENHLAEWDNVTRTNNCDVWVKPTSPPEYRALGSFSDIPATTFFQTQLDLAYRRQWDKLVVKLEVIDKDDNSGTEVLQWVTNFPFPFDPREYIYQRRYKVDHNRKAMLVISKSCAHPKVPTNSHYVRVRSYYSALLIRPHRTFEEDGFDYVLVYVDDPQTFLPKMAIQYAAKSSLPDFMGKLHDAAKIMLKKLGRPGAMSMTKISDKENVRVSVSGGDVFVRSSARLPAP